MNFIYVLRCPLSGLVRYVGKTSNPRKRLTDHMRAARAGEQHHRAKWIRVLLAQGLRPLLEVLHSVPDGENWQDAEIRLIAEYRAAGHALTNGTSGGDGLNAPSADVLRRMSQTAKARAALPEVREAMSGATKAQWKRLRSDGASLDQRNRLVSEAVREMWSAPALKSARLAALHAPEVKAKRYATRDTPENTAARVEKLKAAWADPVRRAARIAKMQTPEAKTKRAAASQEMHARRKAVQQAAP